MTRPTGAAALGLLLASVSFAAAAEEAGETLLLRQPTLSREHLAFIYGGDVWVTDRDGQHPHRLTAQASAFSPHFSPDGQSIAYSASYAGNVDVYVIPAAGGQPRRLTFHPARDVVNGWSIDGERILFASPRAVANNRSNQLYEIAATGGFEHRIMAAVAYEGAWSPEGTRLAYRPYVTGNEGSAGWRQYRGGETTPIWILNPATGTEETVPHVDATDKSPVWAGDEVIFISDRNDGAANLFAYDPRGKALRQLTHEAPWDVRSVGVFGRTAVYEVAGGLKELDLDSGQTRALHVSLATEARQLRPEWKDASKNITSSDLSPTGKRIVITARGDVFTVPVKDGSVRNLTRTPGVREKDALWSPDGTRIAYIGEVGMQHALVVRDQRGLEPPQTWPLGKAGYFTLLAWSPDSSMLVYHDNHLNLYAFSLARKSVTHIDRSQRRAQFQVSFSPDSRWLAYTVQGENYFGRIRIHDFTTGRNVDFTDGLSDAADPVFAPGGYLYFTASINSGPSQVGLDLSSQERPMRRGLYVAVLTADGRSPLLPKPGDEEGRKPEPPPDAACKQSGPKSDAARADGKPGSGSEDEPPGGRPHGVDQPPKAVRIDLEGLGERIAGFPVAERR
ncbi:MAG: PD40 domain-containing protein, partial [Gammaproteobacteria bacterium]|nr:PD40 domain-containing protein [Gammaproteobacteria bacterium]